MRNFDVSDKTEVKTFVSGSELGKIDSKLLEEFEVKDTTYRGQEGFWVIDTDETIPERFEAEFGELSEEEVTEHAKRNFFIRDFQDSIRKSLRVKLGLETGDSMNKELKGAIAKLRAKGMSEQDIRNKIANLILED